MGTGKARNYALASGVYRFGKGKMYHKKALYKKIKRQVPKKVAKSAPAFIEKPIGGDKNGGTRMVRVKKLPAYYAPELKGKKSSSKNFFQAHPLFAPHFDTWYCVHCPSWCSQGKENYFPQAAQKWTLPNHRSLQD